jgi:ribonucleotide reductase class II
VGSNLLCNLSEIHLNQLNPLDLQQQKLAFEAGALSVAALLHHVFVDERYRVSRELDPIVGVSFTGLFDFFVQAFGSDWLHWWQEGRPEKWYIPAGDYKRIDEIAKLLGLKEDDELYSEKNDFNEGLFYCELEQRYLRYWRECVYIKLFDYCEKHGLKLPNRYTTVQPSGTKALLTGASAGWHPPKAQRYIRRITFTAHDPVALACLDYGYSVLPSQSCKDDDGRLLDDPFDPRVTEWLVEIPVEVSWANLPGADQIDISKFSAEAQFKFYMQVQQFYVTHNTSATIELRENEIDEVGHLIHNAIQDDQGYISCALLARFDANETFPRLPFEPISKEHYDELESQVLTRRKSGDFQSLLEQYDRGWNKDQGVVGCDSDKCMMPEAK